MKLYFAPLEGITTYTFRNTHAEMFGGVDSYFAPFINPSDQEKVSRKGMRDILPDNDTTNRLKVQVLTSNSESFLKFCEKIKTFGYNEVNINIGCPAGTVVKKGRGSGFLQYPEKMDEFFCGIFEKCDMAVSVKTRIGYSSHDEMPGIMEIYNKYPISELTIHPRTREELYNGSASLETFGNAYNISQNPVCYNGDICDVSNYAKVTERFTSLSGVMLGRGAVRNPALFREICGGEKLCTGELVEFSERLSEKYRKVLGSDVFTLHKLKEIWVYAGRNFLDEKKKIKAIHKANTLEDFKSAIRALPEM